MRHCSLALFAVAVTLGVASATSAQNVPPAAPSPPASAQSSPAGPTFKQEELDAMLAPIALYPDALLSQVLMASTYPLEIVQAARWRKENSGLKGAALEDALKDQPWDESVKSLTAFPEVLDRMNKDLTWTQKLGDAFLAQQAQVMDTVQNLRGKAQAAGNLKSNEQQKVEVQKEGTQTYIVIEPANPEIVYVPTYQPTVVYGGWWWPSYPPYYPPYWAMPHAAFVNGFFWGAGIVAGAALWGGWNWNNHDVNINVNRYNNFNRTNISNGNWSHNVNHRGAVPYRDSAAREKYGRTDRQAAQAREQFRGREGSLGGADLSDRAALSDAARGGAGDRMGTTQGGMGDRSAAGGGSRPDLGVSSRGSAERNYGASPGGSMGGGGAFGDGNGGQARAASDRGRSSMGANSSMRAGGGARAGGGGGRGGGGRR